jgi:hypothetical protein
MSGAKCSTPSSPRFSPITNAHQLRVWRATFHCLEIWNYGLMIIDSTSQLCSIFNKFHFESLGSITSQSFSTQSNLVTFLAIIPSNDCFPNQLYSNVVALDNCHHLSCLRGNLITYLTALCLSTFDFKLSRSHTISLSSTPKHLCTCTSRA